MENEIVRLSERMRILWSGTKVPRRGTKVPRRETKVPRNTEERNKKNGDNMESCMEELYRGGYDR